MKTLQVEHNEINGIQVRTAICDLYISSELYIDKELVEIDTFMMDYTRMFMDTQYPGKSFLYGLYQENLKEVGMYLEGVTK